MKTETYESLGHEIVIAIPSTVEEYDSLAKRQGACLGDAIDHMVYHSTLSEVRETLVKAIEAKTGINRLEIPQAGKFIEKDGKKTQVTKRETANDYYNRVCAEKNLDPDAKPFAALATAISQGGANEIKFDPSINVRVGKPKALPAEYLEIAKQAIAKNHLATIAKNYTKELGKPCTVDTKLTGDALATTLGWAIREMKLARDKKAGLEQFLSSK